MTRRLYLPPAELRAGTVTITGDSHHYMGRVLRARLGDRVTLFDGQGRLADAELAAIGADSATLHVDNMRTETPPPCPLTVALPLLKGERMDACVQKLVELGVAVIAPVVTERTVVRVAGQRAEKRRQRFCDIAIGAARQSQRAFVPRVAGIVTLAEFLQTRRTADGDGLQLVLSPVVDSNVDHKVAGKVAGQCEPLRKLLAGEAPAAVCLLIGPEGGLTEGEVQAARVSGFRPVGLGPHVLRADTAALAGVVAVKFAFTEIAG